MTVEGIPDIAEDRSEHNSHRTGSSNQRTGYTRTFHSDFEGFCVSVEVEEVLLYARVPIEHRVRAHVRRGWPEAPQWSTRPPMPHL